MLESRSLLLEWVAAAAGAPDRRHNWAHADRVLVRDRNGTAILGVAQRPDTPTSWFRRGREVEVLEGEDRALLFTLRRYWFVTPFWLVDDSEGSRVGTIKNARARQYQFDRRDSPIARLPSERESGVLVETVNGAEGQVLTPYNSVLASLRLLPEHTVVEFGDDLAGDPFARMLVLATALLWGR